MAPPTTTRSSRSGTYDADAELGVLRILTAWPEEIGRVADDLYPRHFVDEANQDVYAHMLAIRREGQVPEAVLVQRRIRESNGKGRCEPSYINELALEGGKIPASNLEHHAGRVQKLAAKRHAMAAYEAARDRLDSGESIKEVQKFVDDELQTIRTGAQKTLTYFSDIESREIAWLWPGRIALGKTTNVQGDPGCGKSVLTIDWSARVSAGYAWPGDNDKPTKPGSVILLSAEDDPHDTVKPRLVAAGADVSKVAVLSSCILDGNDSPKTGTDFVSLETDLAMLEAAISEAGDCRLVVIDPVSAYLPKVNSHVDAELRSVLKPVSALAMKTGVAIVNVMHMNKCEGKSALNRGMGSLAFNAAARAVWLVARDKDDKAKRLFLPVKNNCAPECGGLAFTVVASPDNPAAPVISWYADAVDISADQALEPEKKQGAKVRTAGEWLTEILAGGPVPMSEIKEKAAAADFGWRTIERAKSALAIESIKGEFQGQSKWKLAKDGGMF